MDLKKYEYEILQIISDLHELEDGIFYENKKKAGIPSAKTIARNINMKFIELLEKISNEEPGMFEIRKEK